MDRKLKLLILLITSPSLPSPNSLSLPDIPPPTMCSHMCMYACACVWTYSFIIGAPLVEFRILPESQSGSWVRRKYLGFGRHETPVGRIWWQLLPGPGMLLLFSNSLHPQSPGRQHPGTLSRKERKHWGLGAYPKVKCWKEVGTDACSEGHTLTQWQVMAKGP